MSSREAQAGPTSSARDQLGERFASGLRVRGRYRVISEIGTGAFGTVCLGEDESTGHRVAIRFLPRNFAATPQASQTVLRMGRSIIAASSSHPAIARVLEFGELDAGRPFTVTEFVEGHRLSEVMSSRAPLEIPAALQIALELGGAVETLHNMGFIHGAISPRNVVVLEDGRVKLLDGELAGLRDLRELDGLVSSEPPAEYLAPEQIQKALITEKTDIYAFGLILHEVLSGAPPFQGPTRDAIFAKHLRDAPVPIHRRRDGVPASVSRAVTLALYKQPEARPLMGDVLNLLWTGAHGPAPRRRRAAIVAGGAAALAAAAIVAVVWGVLALRPPAGSAPAQPTARPTIEAVPATPATLAPPPLGARVPEVSVAPTPKPSAPVTRAPSAAPTAAVAPPTRTPAVTPPAPTPVPPAPAAAVAPPAPTPVPPAPAAKSPSAVATSPARPAPPEAARPTVPVTPRAERREPPQTPPASAPKPAPSSDREDSTAAIDWLLKARGQ
ncbi:MAG: hypothetical protein DMD87_28335 [Candidatus Rokuibacteriota bacterium]|nr:MAG: hypothetical protein DMD87_28335 [Candidatus Rokubacteria bacterium]